MILPILIFVLINSIGNTVSYENVDIRDVPFHVSIRNKWDEHICSGAITKSFAVVASGYCSDLKDISHIVAGTVYTSESSERHKQIIQISEKDIITAGTSKTYLVVFYLEEDLIFNEYVQPIKRYGMSPGEVAKVTGFTKINNIVRLRSTEISVKYDCPNRAYDKDEWRLACIVTNSKKKICSALEKSSIFLCFDDNDGIYRLCGFAMPVKSDVVCESNHASSPFHGHFSSLMVLENFLVELGVLDY